MRDKGGLLNGLAIGLAAVMLVAVFCYGWAELDRLSWVRAVIGLVPPGRGAVDAGAGAQAAAGCEWEKVRILWRKLHSIKIKSSKT